MPRKTTASIDNSLLQAALEGLMLQKARIEQQIGEVRGRLDGRGAKVRAVKPAETEPRKRQLSPAARKRIAAAQKRRWAEFRKKSEAAA